MRIGVKDSIWWMDDGVCVCGSVASPVEWYLRVVGTGNILDVLDFLGSNILGISGAADG